MTRLRRFAARALRGVVIAGACAGLVEVSAAPAGAETWGWPLPGRPIVVRGFTPPTTTYGAGHRGIDLAGHPGAPVLAAGVGVIGYAGVLAGRGVVTVLHAGGLRTTYEPVAASVRSGEHVGLGQVIGTLAGGHPGCQLAACLHWGLLRGETYLDPLALLGLGRVRLLPLAAPATHPSGAAARGAGAAKASAPGAARTPPTWRRGAAAAASLALLAGLAVRCGLGGLGRSSRVAACQPGLPRATAGRPSGSAAGERPWCASGRSGFP